MLYCFFWVITWGLNFICRRFGTLCLFYIQRQVGMKNEEECLHTYLPMKMKQSVSKRRHIKFRRRGVAYKKAYNNLTIFAARLRKVSKILNLNNLISRNFLSGNPKCAQALRNIYSKVQSNYSTRMIIISNGRFLSKS
jgi:hypothetical protein